MQRRASSANGGSLPSSISPSSNGHTSDTTSGEPATEIQLAIERRNNIIAALQAVRRLDADGRRPVIRALQAVDNPGAGENFISDFINEYTLPIRPDNDRLRTPADPVDEIIRGYNTLLQQVQYARGSNGINLSDHDRSRLVRVQRLVVSVNDLLNPLAGPNERSES
jgi:hypothetical protein